MMRLATVSECEIVTESIEEFSYAYKYYPWQAGPPGIISSRVHLLPSYHPLRKDLSP